jgi:hypothetical protein
MNKDGIVYKFPKFYQFKNSQTTRTYAVDCSLCGVHVAKPTNASVAAAVAPVQLVEARAHSRNMLRSWAVVGLQLRGQQPAQCY